MKQFTLSLFHIFLLLSFVFFGMVLHENLNQHGGQHFSTLASSFLQGRLDLVALDEAHGDLDTYTYEGKRYWPALPFPAVLLMPFVFLFQLFGLFFYQGYLQFFLTIGVFVLSFRLAKIKGFTTQDSAALAFASCFGSNYAFAAFFSASWFFVYPLTIFLGLLAIYEWFTKRRLFLIGVYCACILGTRFTSAGIIGFFLLNILFAGQTQIHKKYTALLWLLLPMILMGGCLIAYNLARFGSPWETGYTANNIAPDFQVLMLERHGLFRLENIPTNFYWYFLAPPHPVTEQGTYHLVAPFFKADPWGMSFFIMSPLFLYIFKKSKKTDVEGKFVWITIIPILFILLSWYSAGFFQVGARYVLEFFPLLFLLLLNALPKPLTRVHYIIIIGSAFINLFWITPFLR